MIRNGSGLSVIVLDTSETGPAERPEPDRLPAVEAPGEDQENVSKAGMISSVGILSTKLGGGTTRMSGTSMAAPHVCGVLARYYDQVDGPVDTEILRGLVQLNALLADARGTLRKVDALLAEALAVAGNVREGTTDLAALRREVDATVRKVESMVDELNRKWPFAKDPRELELKLK